MKNSLDIPSEAIDNFYKQIGLNVKKHRTDKGLTQLELAYALGHKSVGLVSQAELYLKKQHFNLEHLYKIAYVLECNIEELISTSTKK